MRTTSTLFLGALLSTAVALSGYRSCVPIEPERAVCCHTNTDCARGDVCVGGGAGGYPGSCQPAPGAGECYSDRDCPWGPCVGGSACGCEQNCPSILGTCDTDPDRICLQDADCGPLEHCAWVTAGVCCLPDEDCDDIYMACQGVCAPHDCPTETVLECCCVRPHCGDGMVAVIQDGCWACVHRLGCQPAAPPSPCGCP